MADALTIFELEADGFTHAACYCEGCRYTVQMPFKMLRHRANFVVASLTLDQLRLKLRCDRCPGRPNPTSIQPWKESPGFRFDQGAHRGNFVPKRVSGGRTARP